MALLAGAGAGCGENDEDKFNDDYKALNDDLLNVGRDLADTLRNVRDMTPDEAAAEFRSFGDELASIRGEFEELDPPDDLKGDLDDLTASLEAASAASEDVAAAVSANDAPAARTATTELLEVSQDVNKAQNKMAEETGADRGQS